MRNPAHLLVLALGCSLFVGCGVSFKSAPNGTEFFKSLTVTGVMRAGSPLTAAVTYEQKIPLDTAIDCEVRQGKNLVKQIGTAKAPYHPMGAPDATPFPGNFSFDFDVSEPGSYKLECFTPADEDNFIIKEFTLAPRADAMSTPPPAGG